MHATTTTAPPARRRRPAPPSRDLTDAELIEQARAGSQPAWNELIRRYGQLVWWAARRRGLRPVDATDVAQLTWLRLVQHVDGLRDPDRVAAWLVTTASREALRIVVRDRHHPVGDMEEFVGTRSRSNTDEADAGMLAEERASLVARAIDALSPRCQRLLRLLMDEEGLQYGDIAERLQMPVGSIGPTRGRCLDCLRRSRLLAAI